MRSGVLGGTFDPPHLAHLVLAAAARRTLALDRVLFVPAGDPWRKANRRVTPAAIRVRMLRAAVEPLSWAEVSTAEVERPGPSYSSRTMTALAGGGGEWWFVLGEDALEDLPHWHDPAGLVAAARLAVAPRGGSVVAVADAVREAVPRIDERIDAVTMPSLTVSSTALRVRVRDGRATEVLLPEGARRVIDEEGLYRDGSGGG